MKVVISTNLRSYKDPLRNKCRLIKSMIESGFSKERYLARERRSNSSCTNCCFFFSKTDIKDCNQPVKDQNALNFSLPPFENFGNWISTSPQGEKI